MKAFKVHLDPDNCWHDLAEKGYIVGDLTAAAVIRDGTAQGNTSVTFRIELTDGTTVLAEQTLRNLDMMRAAIKGRLNV